MDMLDALAQLVSLPGPPGTEWPVAERAGALMAPFVDRVETDRPGNLFGFHACRRAGARTLMLDAHLDEVGFMVTGYHEGYLRFRALGGIDPRILPGLELKLLTDPPRPVIVACSPPHVQEKEEADTAAPIEDLLLDAGLSDSAARAAVPIGTRAVFAGDVFALGAKQVSGHAFDDRACFAVLLRVLELLRDQPLTADLVVCGSVQEELGSRGAKTAAFAVEPDACIVVDVTHAATPDAPKHKTFALGGGPCIGVGPGCHRLLSSNLIGTAKTHGIPYQVEVMEGHTGTNAWPVQISRRGVATAMVSLPLKYMHTPVETLHLDDMENSAQLLARYVLGLGIRG